MHSSLKVIIWALCLHGVAIAEDGQIKRSPAPQWVKKIEYLTPPKETGGIVFVRSQDVLMHLTKQGQETYSGYRIKILSTQGLQLGNLELNWNPASGSPTIHAIKVHRGLETIDLTKEAKFEILRREDQLEASYLTGELTAVYRIADLRVGDEVEFAFSVPVNDPTLGADTAGILFLAPQTMQGRFHLNLSWEPGLKPNIQLTPDMEKAAQYTDTSLDFLFDDPKPISPPKAAPPRFQLLRTAEFSRYSDWSTVSRKFFPLFKKASQLSQKSPLKNEAARIASEYPEPLDRAKAALKLVQDNVRYVYVGLNGGNFIPVSADETWKRRYGDCKGKTALLLALLAELGIEAEAVLVNNSNGDDGMDNRLPNPGNFDHILVRTSIGNSQYWLDGTLPSIVAPSAKPLIPYRWVLPLKLEGADLLKLERKAAERPDELTIFDMDAGEGFDKPAKVIFTKIIRGVDGVIEHNQLSALTPDQLKSSLTPALQQSGWLQIEDVHWRYDPATMASILVVNGTQKLDWDDDGDGDRSITLPGGGFSAPEEKVRPADQDQSVPYYNEPKYTCRVATLHLPKVTKQEEWRTSDDYDTHIYGEHYRRAIEVRNNEVRMVRGYRAELEEIDATLAKKDNLRLTSFDNSMAYAQYLKSYNTREKQNKFPVPAAYEIDWTAENVPCLKDAAPNPSNPLKP